MWDEFVEYYEHDLLSKEQLNKIMDDYYEWKHNVYSAKWRRDFYSTGCKKCGSHNLGHWGPDYEGRESEWGICPTIWETDCMECDCRHTVITNDDNDVLEGWID